MRKDLIQWQQMCIDALNVAEAELSRDYHVHMHAVMGSDDALITYADLTVKLETEYFAARGGHADRSRSEAVTAELVLPALEDLVNDGPGYEDLRSVYHALILARWYRQRFRGTTAPGASTIDSCDVSTLGGQPGWTPEGVWQRYMRSLRQGEYDFTTTSRERRGNLLITRTERYMSGAVDFSNIPTVTAGRIDPMYASLVQSAFSRRGGAPQPPVVSQHVHQPLHGRAAIGRVLVAQQWCLAPRPVQSDVFHLQCHRMGIPASSKAIPREPTCGERFSHC